MSLCIIFNPVARHVNQENLTGLDRFPIYSPFTMKDSNLVTARYSMIYPIITRGITKKFFLQNVLVNVKNIYLGIPESILTQSTFFIAIIRWIKYVEKAYARILTRVYFP